MTVFLLIYLCLQSLLALETVVQRTIVEPPKKLKPTVGQENFDETSSPSQSSFVSLLVCRYEYIDILYFLIHLYLGLLNASYVSAPATSAVSVSLATHFVETGQQASVPGANIARED